MSLWRSHLHPRLSMLLPPEGGGREGGTGAGRLIVAALVLTAAVSGCKESSRNNGAPPTASARGQQLFKERCASCHPDGGNVVNPKKTLNVGVLADNGITTPADIVNKMRNPGPGMVRFDAATIPDADARLIAEYVLATYR